MEKIQGRKKKHEAECVSDDAATPPKRTKKKPAEEIVIKIEKEEPVIKIEKEEPDEKEINEYDVEKSCPESKKRKKKKQDVEKIKKEGKMTSETYNIHISLVSRKKISNTIKIPIQRKKKTTEELFENEENERSEKQISCENSGEKSNPAQKKRKKEKHNVGKKEGKKIVLGKKLLDTVKAQKQRKKKTAEDLISEKEESGKQVSCEINREKSNPAQKKKENFNVGIKKEQMVVLEEKMSGTAKLLKQEKEKSNEDLHVIKENERLGKQVSSENEEKTNPAQKKRKRKKSDVGKKEGKKMPLGKKKVATVTKLKKAKTTRKRSLKTRVNEQKFKAKTESGKPAGNRTRGTSKYIGAHVSIAGGLHRSVMDAVEIGASAFGLFLKSQRTWTSKPLDDHAAKLFQDACKIHGFSPNMILPHGSYLMNCGSPDPEILQKSRDNLVDELQRCEKLGLTLFNFHPGSSCGTISIADCITNIADSINQAHTRTTYVTTVIENMCCQGNTVGGKFKELRMIIDQVKDKTRVGVCLDTCHAFAAGYDLSTETGFEEMIKEFEEVVGFQYLKAMHINDSKGKVGCHLDRHENIGRGHIGVAGFQRIMRNPKFNNIPMILETPCAQDDTYIKEINKLYAMCIDK